jgi:hypothetical protein
MTAATQRAAPAVTPTLTQTAVQQAKAGQRADLLTTHDIVPLTDRRDRLVGPPPTFEVNLLQHLRETRNDPPDADEPQPVQTDSPQQQDVTGKAPEQRAKADDTDALYRQLQPADPTATPSDSVDTRL